MTFTPTSDTGALFASDCACHLHCLVMWHLIIPECKCHLKQRDFCLCKVLIVVVGTPIGMPINNCKCVMKAKLRGSYARNKKVEGFFDTVVRMRTHFCWLVGVRLVT